MDFKIIFTRRRGARAFTLADTMVAVAITGLTFAALGSFTLFSGRSFAAIWNYVDMEQKSQIAIDTMSREVRNTLQVTHFGSNTLSFRHIDGSTLTYSWDPTSKSLVQVKNGEKKVLLTDCNELSFTLWQRSPIKGTWNNYTTATLTNSKLVNVRWRCTRSILGIAMNSESVQTSKIVIRNK